jgi:hypothetical protein
MSGNKALFWHEHIGHHAYRLRIRNNMPEDSRQWFIFDWRTKTIRAWADRRKVMSNQFNYKFRIGVAACMRPWRGDMDQRISWYGGSRKNLRNNA